MTVINLAIVAFVALALCGLFLGLAVTYRRQLRRARWDVETLRKELDASRQWNTELRDAHSAVQHLVTHDPLRAAVEQLPQRNDPLWQQYLLPSFVPEHERGQQ